MSNKYDKLIELIDLSNKVLINLKYKNYPYICGFINDNVSNENKGFLININNDNNDNTY